MQRVLILCTGNSCRSILAEGIINHYSNGKYKAVSAGSSPAGYVHPKSIETMLRHGIEVTELRSKSWNEFENQKFDLVITVCDQAARETCPMFLGNSKKRHWSTPDPASANGTDEEISAAFEATYLMLKERIEKELL